MYISLPIDESNAAVMVRTMWKNSGLAVQLNANCSY